MAEAILSKLFKLQGIFEPKGMLQGTGGVEREDIKLTNDDTQYRKLVIVVPMR